ncbi:alkaline phosphatase family protein [Lignipirellula cremea]|uniref:Sulfatase n=1 Tax=Lignipirellula cremea TaxID=2528010 RepID=A0A518E550_9BACT|nr:hypothetical protein [Lignipirellula cremea]QDU99219.1 Sulfatase [Lignipirellula cremea]
MTKWIFRAVLLAAVALIGLGLFRNAWLLEGKQTIAQAAGIDAAPERPLERSPGLPSEADPADLTGEHSILEGNGLPEMGDMAVPHGVQPDDASDTGLKHSLTRSISQLIDTQQQLLPEGAGDDLRDSLTQADDLLWEAKQNNRRAIRNANRQVRVPGRSPNVLLITVGGLQTSDLAWFGGEAGRAPTLDLLAARSVRQTLTPLAPAAAQRALLTGGDTPALEADTVTLTNMLWASGYETGVVGDCSWWPLSHDVEEWLGARSAAETDPYPESIWSNGRQVKVVGNAGGKQDVSREQLYLAQADSYFSRHRGRRPFFLALSLQLDESRSNLTACDRLIGDVIDSLEKYKMGPRTLVLIVGMPDAGTADPAPLVAGYGAQLPSNATAPTSASYADLAPTLAAFIGSTRQPPMAGTSLYPLWRIAAPQAQE